MRSKAKYNWLCAGLGSGKTLALAYIALNKAIENPESVGFMGAATVRQLHGTVLKTFFQVLDGLEIMYDLNQQRQTIKLETGVVIKYGSLENYEVFRGEEFGWIVLDEICLSKEEAWDVLIGRLRCTRMRGLRQVYAISTPRGKDFMYRQFVASPTPEYAFLRATSDDNPYLPPGYIDSLRAKYSDLMIQQEIEAKFVVDSGLLRYHQFSEKNITPIPPFLTRTLLGGCDFNVDPMTGIVMLHSGHKYHVTHEIYLRSSNTWELAKEFNKLYPNLTVVPDATGKNRKTCSTVTDHEILLESGINLVRKRSNPLREDRIKNVNRLLRSQDLTIDPSCINLIVDFSECTVDGIDKTNTMMGHITDAVGYPIWHYSPSISSKLEPYVRTW